MRKEGDFSSVITLEKSKNQKTKKTGLNSQKTGLNSQKISGKRKNAVLWKFGFCGKHHRPAHFLEEKNLNLTPAFSFPKKKKILKMKKVERKTEIFFSQNESVCGVWGRHDFMIFGFLP